MTRYGFVVDTKQCIGCHTCAVSCKYANDLPADVWYLRVHTKGGDAMDAPEGTYPNCKLSYRPVNCMHCDLPACMDVCPTGSVSKREDGIVITNPDTCIGCQSCIQACPYEGVRTLLPTELEYQTEEHLGTAFALQHKGGTVEKCNLCHERIDMGLDPICIEVCTARCRWFGDFDDPTSEVSKLIKENDYEVLEESAGTVPNIYYLV